MKGARFAAAAALLLATASCAAATPTQRVSADPCSPLPTHAGPECTGVPPDVSLRPVAGDQDGNLVVLTDGAVVDALHVRGSLLIKANDVTVRNSQIDGTVYNDFAGTAYSFTITDSTVGPETGCVVEPGINDANYTATRVRVRGHDDGFRFSPPGHVVVQDSYAKLCYAPPEVAPPDGSHSDGIQAYCNGSPCNDLTFRHNTIDARGIPATFAVNLDDPSIGGNVSVTENLLGGGAYTVVTEWRSGPTWTVQDNRIIDRSWTYGPVSGEGTCTEQDWTGNQIVTVDEDYAVTSVVGPQPCR